MSSILKRNMEFLGSVQPDLKHALDAATPSQALSPLPIRTGEPGLAAGGKALQSRYDPWREATRIVASTVPAETATVLILGLGGGYTVKTVIKTRPGATVLVVERSPGTLKTIMTIIDFTVEIQSRRLLFCVDPEGLRSLLQEVHLPLVRSGAALIHLLQWTEMPENRNHFQSCLETAQHTLRRSLAQAITIRRFARPWLVHTLHNSRRLQDSGETHRAVQRLDSIVRGKTVLVVAAGPGLDQFLERPDLQALLSSLILIAVDTALPALVERGIVAQALVSLDPQPWSLMHIRRSLPRETVLCLDLGVTPLLALRGEGTGTVWFCGTHPLHQLLCAHGAPCLFLPDSPDSVTEAAVLLARAFGAEKVELVGTDGGYPGAKTYARGTAHYAVAARRASRLHPEEHFFSLQVYPGMDKPASPSKASRPFFTSAAMDERSARIQAATSTPSRPDLPPAHPRAGFQANRFWMHHREELSLVIERVASIADDPDPDTPRFMDTLGPHGIAHVPLLFRGKEDGTTPLARRTGTLLRKIQGFIFTENRRYS